MEGHHRSWTTPENTNSLGTHSEIYKEGELSLSDDRRVARMQEKEKRKERRASPIARGRPIISLVQKLRNSRMRGGHRGDDQLDKKKGYYGRRDGEVPRKKRPGEGKNPVKRGEAALYAGARELSNKLGEEPPWGG